MLKPVTRQFLTFQLTDAGRTLDEATFALKPEPPTAAEGWAASLQFTPSARILDAAATEVTIDVKPFYRPTVERPARLRVRASAGEPVAAPLEKLPLTIRVPLPPLKPRASEDRSVSVTVEADGAAYLSAAVGLSRVADLKPRLAKLKTAASGSAADTLEAATVADRATSLAALVAGEVPETDLPAAALLTEAERLTTDESYFTADRPGRFWLTVPTAGGKRTPCRVLVPPKLDPKWPVPVVVALHGAGGSENLYFDGYGAGCVVTECEKRGWLLVAPRGGLGFLGGPPPVTDIVAKLAERYPIDPKRVFLVGHSMGAAQAVDLAQQKPGAFAAVAALGGGGRVRKPGAFAGVPTVVGVGSEDFARSGALGFHKALTDAGVKGVRLKEYPGVEHTVVVRVAVDDLFALFDAAARKTP